MTGQPTITDTHTWDGSTLPDWLHWDGGLTLPGRDDTTPPQPGWMLVRWSDGQVTVASPQVAARVYGPDGMRGRLERAEAELAKRDTAGPHTSAQATLTITVTGPNPVHAVRWAGHVRDLVHAEFDGSMGLHSFIELEPGGTVVPDFTSPLTGIEVRDPCPWCESSPALIPRTLMDEHVATAHPEVQTPDTTASNPAATEATDTWKEPAHPHPCTATIEGRATPGGRRVQCTREARHPENHVGPKQGANGRVLWSDRNEGATPHKEQP